MALGPRLRGDDKAQMARDDKAERADDGKVEREDDGKALKASRISGQYPSSLPS